MADRFKREITEKINEELASGRIYRADDDTNAVVMFTQPKHDDPSKPRFLLQAQPRNMWVEPNHTPMPDIKLILEEVGTCDFVSVADLKDGFHNIRMDENSEQHTIFICYMGQFRSRVMQQGDRNAPATMVRAINDIFKDMLYNGRAIYIDDLIIYTKTYKEHVALLRKVLQCLVDNKFWRKESKCQFFTK